VKKGGETMSKHEQTTNSYELHAIKVQQAIDEHITDEALHEAISRWKSTLFYHDFSSQFSEYFRRVNAFDGYHPGDHHAYGFENDTIGQMYGTVGQLQFYIKRAGNEGRTVNLNEIQAVQDNFLKAAQFRGNSAKMLSRYDHSHYLSEIHLKEQAQIELISQNVPHVIEIFNKI
jgi:hypothetical protein